MEMSASPKLKLPEDKSMKKNQNKKGKGRGAAAKPLGKVAEMRKYFGSLGRATRPPEMSVRPVLPPPLMAKTEQSSAAAHPEMAVQVIGTAGPIGKKQPGHVTSAVNGGPIRTGPQNQPDDQKNVSHI